MNRRIAIGGLIAAALAVIFIRSQVTDNTPQTEKDAPISSEETESRLEEVLGRTIPDDVEKATLTDLTNSGLTAIATRAEEGGVVEFSILADLAESEEPYQVWTGPNQDELISLGTLVQAKGGYLFEHRKAGGLNDYSLVVVNRGETKVLEGSF